MEIEVGQAFEQADIYTGRADVQVLCVNPTLEQIVKLNLPVKKDVEPVYIGKTDTGEDKMILKIWVKHHSPEIITPITFFLEAKENIASTGNIQFINDFGQSTYAKTLDEALARLGKGDKPFFNEEGARAARVGEVALIEFIRKWLCVANDKKSSFKNYTKIIQGDVSEINELIKAYGGLRKVQCLLGENKGYQTVYSRYFDRAGNKKDTWWDKHFEGSSSTFNYQNSYTLKKWTGIEPDVETSGETKQQFSIFD